MSYLLSGTSTYWDNKPCKEGH